MDWEWFYYFLSCSANNVFNSSFSEHRDKNHRGLPVSVMPLIMMDLIQMDNSYYTTHFQPPPPVFNLNLSYPTDTSILVYQN